MSGLIDRLQHSSATPDERARVLEMTERDADRVLDSLASETRRRTLRVLFEEPTTASALADRLDTSVQNVHYHLSDLEDAGLVEPIDAVYSAKGNEMTVYGPASDPIVFVGDRDRAPRLRRSLTEVVGGLGVLGLASVLVQVGAERLVTVGATAPDAVGPAGRDPVIAVPDGTLAWLVFEVVEPGVLFFAGCLVVAALLAVAFER